MKNNFLKSQDWRNIMFKYNSFISLILLFLISQYCLSETVITIGSKDLLNKSSVIAIVTLNENAIENANVSATIQSVIKGNIKNNIIIQFMFPTLDNIVREVFPAKYGQTFLVFLNNKKVGSQTFIPIFGKQGVRRIREDQIDITHDLLSKFLKWDLLDFHSQNELLKKSLSGPSVIRELTLDWLLHEEHGNLLKDEHLNSTILDGIIGNCTAERPDIRKRSIMAIALISKTNAHVIPYLIDRINDSDSDIQKYVVNVLDGSFGGYGPVQIRTATIEDRIAILMKWWNDIGFKDIKFQRYEVNKDIK